MGMMQEFREFAVKGNAIDLAVVVIIGGIGSLGGAALGALLVGLIDSVTKATVSNLSMISIFGALMLVLAFKPNGLLGKGERG